MTTDQSRMRFLSLWAIDAPLDEARLCRQLEAMKADGLDGVVFHPRFFPGQPAYLSAEYLRILSQVILRARDLGLGFWIYDENGWPSGVAGGELLKQFPDDAGGILTLHEGDAADAWHSFTHDNRRWHLQLVRTHEIDYLSPEACRHFLALVHDRYRDGLDPAAWAHVEAFFTDEPEFGLGVNIDRVPPHGALPWSPGLPDLYRQQFGRDILDDLPSVFFNNPDGAHEDVRIRFWEFLTDRLCEGFFAPYQAWCRREGKLFTGHLKGDEHPLFQVMLNGSCHQLFRHFDMPGIDPLERFPGCNFYARQVASAARQFGSGRVMAEAMGGGGWGSKPEDFERFCLWLSNNGATDIVIHLCQYRLNSHAIRDWPPANPNGLNWRPAYANVLRRIRETTDASAVADADTLVVAPYRGIMAGYEPWSLPLSNIHDCSTHPDTAASRLNNSLLELLERLPARHHFADERSLEDAGRVEGGRLFVGNHAYTTVVLAEGCRIGADGQRMLREFADNGGQVLTPGEVAPVVQPAAPSGATDIVPIRWESATATGNDLLLEPAREAGGAWVCAFEAAAHGAWTIEFADDIQRAELDGTPLALEPSEEGSSASLPPLSEGRHEVRFYPVGDDPGPLFVWLHGSFCVRSRSPWTAGSDGMLRTGGPWIVEPLTQGAPDAERVAEGWPFAREPLTVQGTFTVSRRLPAGTRISFATAAADAARVTLDGTGLGWIWGPDWSVPLPGELAEGEHRLSLELVPSTYNRFGPHHHIDGDRHVVSPDQFTGRKNFADRVDSPEYTHDSNWRFRPVQPPGQITLYT